MAEIKEVKKDLFSVPEEYYLAHCISADFALGAGIAQQFNRRLKMRDKLIEAYPHPNRHKLIGTALLIDRTFNLVTKERYWHKPTYTTLYNALMDMSEQVKAKGIKKIAMPLIGCGLDRLEWFKVRATITNVFAGTDVEILVCRL